MGHLGVETLLSIPGRRDGGGCDTEGEAAAPRNFGFDCSPLQVPDTVGSAEIMAFEIRPMEDVESVGSCSPCNSMIYNESFVHTEDQTQHFQGSPELKTSRGKMTMALLLALLDDAVSYVLANFAFFGVAVGLVVFLRQVLHQENAEAANSVSMWMGTVYIFSLFCAFLSDSYMGRYITCIMFQFIFIVGLMLLSLLSWFLLVEPPGCGDGGGLRQCAAPSRRGVAVFYLSIYMAAFGNGGYQPSVATFGADQFDDADPGERRRKQAFFCLFYLSLNVGSLFYNSVLVFFEDRGPWVAGFWVSTAAAALALALFLLGTPRYRRVRPAGNPLTRIAQVFVAAYRKRHIVPPPGDHLHEVDGEGSAIRGVGKLAHSDQLRFLDKAATATEEDYHDGNAKNPWRLCTVTQVEEAKCVVSMVPIWICSIVYSVEFTQMSSLFVEQGAAMDTDILGLFNAPAASMSVFDVAGVLATLAFSHYVLVPAAARLTKNPRGRRRAQAHGRGPRDRAARHGRRGGRRGPPPPPIRRRRPRHERAVAGAAVRGDGRVGGVRVRGAAGVLQRAVAGGGEEPGELAVHGVHLAGELRQHGDGERHQRRRLAAADRRRDGGVDPGRARPRPPRPLLHHPRRAVRRGPRRVHRVRAVVQGHRAGGGGDQLQSTG
ncbi:hypothetical protein OsJ_21165 [Oryza sativa Japonica Group]|uniref:Uncharacterized protein n=1 Tax=Oryza sativa subsp. japonica TaxID=39947 RepID=B9FT02_ORYSJ|nr:hypothetical protein OsJ_21165 [Oryza sativa Japonica Group]